MTGWHEGQWLPFDLETTGRDPHEARIVQYAIGRVGGGKPSATVTRVVNPGVSISSETTAIHGITDEMAADGQTARLAVDLLAEIIAQAATDGVPIVGWNVGYDLTVLSAELSRHDLPALEMGYVLDGLVIDKAKDRYRRGSRKLVDVARLIGVELGDAAHDAGADALAAARVTWKLCQRHGLHSMPLAELHQAQVGWAREQADSLRAYFDRKGTEHDGVDGTWPIRQRTQVAA